mmetsp:Transcript_20572/g.50723  ORF Transcript_20572/g.50723 Transcript_20572/m.50723 type:complete len:487 (+) Transcript_20572:232-1692(+)
MPRGVVAAVRQDLDVLSLFGRCDPQLVADWVNAALDAGAEGPIVTWEDPIEDPGEEVVAPQEPAVAPELQPGEEREVLARARDVAVAARPAAAATAQMRVDMVAEAAQVFGKRDDWAWSEKVAALAHRCRAKGTGVFAHHAMFKWNADEMIIEPVNLEENIQLDDIVGCTKQRDLFVRNVEFLLNGYPAQNVLLLGAPGTGKTALVKAVVNEYKHAGLKLVQVEDSWDLTAIIEEIACRPALKFIVFIDDLGWEEEGENYKAIRAIIDGDVAIMSSNMILCATSVGEEADSMGENLKKIELDSSGDHPEYILYDSQPKNAYVALSDRFGLTLVFDMVDIEQYLKIVCKLAAKAGLTIAEDVLEYRALQWAKDKNTSCGRTARQFVSFVNSEQKTLRLLRSVDVMSSLKPLETWRAEAAAAAAAGAGVQTGVEQVEMEEMGSETDESDADEVDGDMDGDISDGGATDSKSGERGSGKHDKNGKSAEP